MAPPRILETPRLLLRDPRPGDAQAMFEAYAGDPAVLRYLGWRAHDSVADTAKQIGFEVHRWLKGSAWVWVMTQRQGPTGATGPVFGQVALIPMSHPSDKAYHLRLGYMMAPSHWGQGLMHEALAAVMDAAMSLPQVWRVDALVDVDNGRSAALLNKLGMRREGCLGRVVLHPNAGQAPRSAWLFATTRDDWPGARAFVKVSADPASAADLACADRNR